MFLSLIIAVYNIESYLKKCLDSLVSLDIENYELILVVGNSDDNSNEISQEYEEKYSNITVLMQNGKGLSDARNCGMNIAKGEFVMFVDGDDYILTENFNNTLNKLKSLKEQSVDVLVSDYYMVNENNNIVSEICQIGESSEPICDCQYIENFMKQYICFWNVWRYIYKRSFLNENQIIFKEDYLCEDIDYTTKVFMKAKNVVYYHNPYYCYRVGRKNSLMNIVNIKRVNDTVDIIESSINYIVSNNNFKYKQLMVKKFLFEYILNMATIYEVPKLDRYKAKKVFYNTRHLLNVNFYGFARLIYIMTGIIGIEPIAYLLLRAKKIKRIRKKIKLRKIK